LLGGRTAKRISGRIDKGLLRAGIIFNKNPAAARVFRFYQLGQNASSGRDVAFQAEPIAQ